jgi:hypothetical protein
MNTNTYIINYCLSLLSLIFRLTLGLIGLGFASSILSAATIDDLQFTLINDGTEYSVSAVDATSIAGELDIPTSYNGKPVTEISALGFGVSVSATDFPDITSVTIPASIKTIGAEAFQTCRSLSMVTFAPGSQLTTLGSFAFKECNTLASIELPNSITSIEDSTFVGCRSLTSVVLPDSLTAIKSYAFYYCTSLTSIELPNSITSIGDWAFASCSALTSINLPNSITSIEVYAFYSCSALTSINLPNSITSIGMSAFSHCKSLTSIDLPDSITSIPNFTFRGCKALTSVNLPDSLTAIEYSAFSNCESLTSIELPESLTKINALAFSLCYDLASITFLGAAPTLGDNAFLDTGRDAGGLVISIYPTHEASYDSWRSLYTFNVVQEPFEPVVLYAQISYDPSSSYLSITTESEPSSVALTLQHREALNNAWATLSTADYEKVTDTDSNSVTRTVLINPNTSPSGFYRLMPEGDTSPN